MRTATVHLLSRYGFAVIIVALVTGGRLLLDPALGTRSAFAFFFIAVLLTAWYRGFGPAIAAVVLSVLSVTYFLLPPRGTFADKSIEQQVSIEVFLVVSLGIAILGGSMRLSRERANRIVEEERHQRRQLDITLRSIGDAVIVTDPEGRVTLLNSVAQKLTGWAQEEATCQPLELVFRIVEEETRRAVESPVIRALRDGAIADLANHTLLISRDGTERPIEDSTAPIRDSGGSIRGAVLVFRDVTERRRAEQERIRLAAIVESSSDAIISKTLDGVIQSWNRGAERLFGFKGEEAIGRPITLIIPPDREREELIEKFETVRIAKDGRRLDVSMTVSPLRDENGRLIGISEIARDITEHKRAGELLRASEQRFRTLFESMGEGFCVVEMLYDAEGAPVDYRFLEVNPTFEAHTGLKDALGRTILEMVPGHDAHWFEIYGRVAATGEPIRFVNEARAMGRWYDVYAYRAGGPDSRRVALLFSDITTRRRAETLLKESEERYRTLFNSIDQGFCIIDVIFVDGSPADYRFVEANKVFEQQTGLAGVVGRTIRELVPTIEERWFEIYGRIATTAEPVRFVESSEALGRWFDVFASQTGGPESRKVAILFTDITERKLAEAERERLLRQFEIERGQLAAVFQLAPSFMCVLRGPDHVFERANDRSVDLVGGRELIGRTVRDALPEVAEQGFIDLLDQVYRSGEAYVGTGVRVLLQGDSGRQSVERFLDFAYQPLRENNGAVTGILVQGVDLTERVRAEAERARLTETLSLALSAADLGTWEWDPATDLITLSDRGAAIYELPAGQTFSREWMRGLIHPDHQDRARAAATRAATERGEYDIEYLLVRPLWLSVRGRGVYDASGKLIRMLGVVQDITKRKESEEALREADRKKDDFIALLAHELRNPLAPIRNGLQVLRFSKDPENRERSQAMMDRQLAHMVRMIDDLLDVSRISRNKMELRRARVALADIVGSAVEMSKPFIEESSHELSVSVPPESIFLDADLTRLSQVFSNLLTNSAKYTERGGKIWLSASALHQEVEVLVRDTGIGIPSDALPHIFNMFSQVDRPIERSTGGLGIGLALVKGLVEMHGGTVRAESKGLGQGSTFLVRLPRLADAEASLPKTNSHNGQNTSGPKRHILVVDDNRDSADSLAMMLELFSNEVRTANDGFAALEEAEKFRPEVILMDVGMPKLNGLEATRQIRSKPWGKSMTIIALTGWGQEADRERSREAGCDGHLVKPVHIDELQKLLADLNQKEN